MKHLQPPSYPFEQSAQLALGLNLSVLAPLDVATIPTPADQPWAYERIGLGCFHRLAAQPAE